MIIDSHAHLYDPRWYPLAFNQQLADDLLATARGASSRADAEHTVQRLLRDPLGELTVRIMDRIGIERRVIAILDWGLALTEPQASIHEIHREVLGACARFPDRLIGLAGVDPRRHDAAAVLRRAFDDLGARGLKLHPTSDWSLMDDRTVELIEMAAQRRLPVLVHAGRTMSLLQDKHCQPAAVLQLARAVPHARFIAGHCAFEQWPVFTAAAPPANLYCDISGWQAMIGDDRKSLRAALAELCAAFPGRVCFGSDSPFFTFNLASTESAWLSCVRDCTPPQRRDSVLCNPLWA
jgi:uncharacterized protein